MGNIMIVGAGYAGVMAARELEKAEVPFTLINALPYHQLTTWLHEAAGGRRPLENYKIDLQELFHQSGTRIVIDEINQIIRDERVFVGKTSRYHYDYGILGVGSTPEYFGIDGLKEYSLPLKSLESARIIRQHIEGQFAKFTETGENYLLKVVIGGGGLTGIEFAGELAEWLPELSRSFKIGKEKFEIVCVEAANDILPMMSESLRSVAKLELEGQGVRFMTSAKIVHVHETRVILESGAELQTGTFVWTGGVRANSLLSENGFTCDRKGRALVLDTLQSVDDHKLWIVGDCSSFEKSGRPLPPTAQLATQMGVQAAYNLKMVLRGEIQRPFQPKIYGTLASLGSTRGVGDVIGLKTKGKFAGMAKEFTKFKYLLQIGGLRMVNRKRKTFVLGP